MGKIIEVNKHIRRRASVFDPYMEEVKEYIEIGISTRAMHKLVSKKMSVKFTYDGFYAWLKRNSLLHNKE